VTEESIQEEVGATIGDIFASISDDRKWAAEHYGADAGAVITTGIKLMDYLTGMYLDDNIERGSVEYVMRQLKEATASTTSSPRPPPPPAPRR
jgi:hypothetical protein